jgi:peptidoglycan/xylan/chitin deacetylase (PgdA/CDA1 family)
MDYALQHLHKEQHLSFGGKKFIFRPDQHEISSTAFTNLRNMIKNYKQPYKETMREVDAIINDLESNAGCCLADIFEKDHFTAIMSWEEAKLVAAKGITIGSHTVDHAILDRLDLLSVAEQLTISKKNIEQHIGRPCSYFCYPNGNWNDNIVSLVRKAGFIAATTTDRGSNKIGNELLTLHRVNFLKVL